MSDNMEMTDKVLGRIRALLNKTVENGCTEGEASAAQQKASEILQSYNMTMAELSSAGAEKGVARKRDISARGANYPWQVDLMRAIAKANFCKHWIESVRDTAIHRKTKQLFEFTSKRHALLGREVNVISCNLMYDYLLQAMNRLSPFNVGGGQQSKSAHSWKLGCSERLARRIVDDHEAALAESRRRQKEEEARRAAAGEGASGAMVLADVYSSEEDLNEDEWYGLPAGTTAARRRKQEAEHAAWIAKYMARQKEPVVYVEPAPVKPETEAQRRAREKKAAREDAAFWARQNARQRREAQRVDQNAYAMGQASASSISLNRQVDKTTRERLK